MADADVPFLLAEGSSTGSVVPKKLQPQRGLVGAFVGLVGIGMCFGVCVHLQGRRSAAPVQLATTAKVRVEVYGMAGCPFTRGFVEGPLAEVIDTVPELVDLDFTPFGNSYYPTAECGGSAGGMPYASYNQGYDQNQRQCWDKLCGLHAAEPPAECFTGELICQHGATDGMVTSAWACAKALSGNSAPSYLPFFVCTAQKFLAVTSADTYNEVVASCAQQTGFNPDDVLACAASYGTLNAQGRRTPAHPAVPYALIDGEVLGDTSCVACGDGIINKVCEISRSKGGPRSPVCDAILR